LKCDRIGDIKQLLINMLSNFCYCLNIQFSKLNVQHCDSERCVPLSARSWPYRDCVHGMQTAVWASGLRRGKRGAGEWKHDKDTFVSGLALSL